MHYGYPLQPRGAHLSNRRSQSHHFLCCTPGVPKATHHRAEFPSSNTNSCCYEDKSAADTNRCSGEGNIELPTLRTANGDQRERPPLMRPPALWSVQTDTVNLHLHSLAAALLSRKRCYSCCLDARSTSFCHPYHLLWHRAARLDLPPQRPRPAPLSTLLPNHVAVGNNKHRRPIRLSVAA